MPNAKLKCAYCKKYFPREQMKSCNKGNFCCDDHMVKYALKHVDKGRRKLLAFQKKENARKKREFYENDIKTRKKAAKKACHDYIRARDAGKPCICCGEPLGPKFDAGHYLESGNNSRVRYDEDNIHGQRVYCNQHKGGNLIGYRKGLIEKIGLERVERLENTEKGPLKRTAQDYKEIELYYKQKLKELQE